MQGECVLPARSLWGSSAALTALAPLFGAMVVLWKSTVLCPSIEFSCGMKSASSRCLSLNKASRVHLGISCGTKGYPCGKDGYPRGTNGYLRGTNGRKDGYPGGINTYPSGVSIHSVC